MAIASTPYGVGCANTLNTERLDRDMVETSPVLTAALDWARRGVGVVPVRPSLVPNDKGKLSPIPWIRWQQDGPLRGEDQVHEFWSQHPDAQLAILLEEGLVTVDVDLKKLPSGQAPNGFSIPSGPGYRETTKSGGLHYVFVIKEQLDPRRSTRVVQLADYVDVLAGGILVVAPTRFTNAPQGYELLTDSLPVFPTMMEALGRYAQWLPGAWKERWEKSLTATDPARSSTGGPGRQPQPQTESSAWSVDVDELQRAVTFVQTDRDTRRFFAEGFRDIRGAVDHSQTEWRLAARLKDQGFSKAVVWSIIRMCQHTKSPYDRRGRHYFEIHVWGRLEARK
jgi:hypothetical protein